MEQFEQKKSSKKKIVIVVAVVVAAMLLVGYFATANAAKPEEEESLLREYPVSRGDITAGIDGGGSLVLDGTPQNFQHLVKLEKIYVKRGDTVKKGDKLAKISEEALQTKLDELETLRKKAEIAVEDAGNNKNVGASEMRQVDSPEEAGSAEYQMQRAQTQATATETQQSIDAMNARAKELEGLIADLSQRIGKLDAEIAALPDDDPKKKTLQAERKALAKEHDAYCAEHDGIGPKLTEAQNTLQSINAELQTMDSARAQQVDLAKRQRAKENSTNSLKMNGYANSIRTAEVELADIERQMKEVQAAQKEVYLYAQQDGMILDVGFSEGMETTADKAAFTIGSLEDLYAQLQVTQTDIGSIEQDQIVELQFDAYPERKFKGKVTRKLPLPIKDSNPVAYNVNASVDTEGEDLFTGMTCSAQFIIKQVKDVLILSNKAIGLSESGDQVVKLKDAEGNLYEQKVETGFSDGKTSEILSGLKDGDIVYVEG